MLNSSKYVEPGYPVYRTFIVPYRDDNTIRRFRLVSEEDVEEWKKTLDKLHEFLANYWSNLSERDTISTEDKLSIVADLTAIFFKLPLIKEPLPQIVPNPIKVYLRLRSLCHQPQMADFIRRHVKKPTILLADENMRKALRQFLKSEFVRLLDDRETASLVEKAWFVFPSDTRPGFNSSSLLSHLFLTSAIAWSLAVQEGMNNRRAAMLRLSSIFHDVGKPLDPEHHYKVGAEVARPVLEGILSESEIEEIANFVEEHHIGKGTKEAQILKDADRYASAVDRVSSMVENLLGDTVKAMAKTVGLEMAESLRETDWEFWRRLYVAKDQLKQAGFIKGEEDPIKELSSMFVKKLDQEPSRSQPDSRSSEGEVKGVNAFLLDIGGIQNYVMRSTKLPNTVAASLTVDLLVMAFLPLHIQLHVKSETGLYFPYESFVYTAGGIDFLIAPSRLQGHVEEVAEVLSKDYKGLPIRVASTQFVISYPMLSDRLAASMEARKFTITHRVSDIETSYVQGKVFKLCQLCNLDPNIAYDRQLRSHVCDECKALYGVGSNLHFAERWERSFSILDSTYTPSNVFNMSWEEVSEYIMELISGHDRRELELLEAGRVERRNIALLKLDGNLMGAFMAGAISISDALERSVRIDLALKKAYEKALQTLFTGVKAVKSDSDVEAAKPVSCVKLGTLYMGGDDALIFTPSWVALPLALVIGEEFAANMGGKRSLSLGIAVASSTQDVWLLVDAASKLMDMAKGVGRENIDVGAACFDIASTGMLSGHIVAQRFNLLEEMTLSAQPFIIKPNDRSAASLEELLNKILNPPNKTREELFTQAYLASRPEEKNEVKELLKDVRSGIKEVIAASEGLLGSGGSRPTILGLAYLYNARQVARKKGKKTLHYEITGWSLTHRAVGTSKKLLIADLDRAVDILGGGAL